VPESAAQPIRYRQQPARSAVLHGQRRL
jgi:hypothetical protein